MVARRVVSVAVLSMTLLVGPAPGAAAASPPPGVDPKADDALRRMSEALARAEHFRFEVIEWRDEVLEFGQKVQFETRGRLWVSRPCRVVADFQGDLTNEKIYYSVDTLTVLDRIENVYGKLKVPGNIDEMLDYIAQYFRVAMPLSDLLFADPYATLVHDVEAGRYMGLHHVGGDKCHHLAFQQRGLDWQIWIQEEAPPVPRKIVITYKAMPGQPQFVALLDKWDLSSGIPHQTFSFDPPAGAREIELKPAGGTGASGGAEGVPPDAGEKAP